MQSWATRSSGVLGLPHFQAALSGQAGRLVGGRGAQRSLYECANGYNYEAVKIFLPAGSNNRSSFTTSNIAHLMLVRRLFG